MKFQIRCTAPGLYRVYHVTGWLWWRKYTHLITFGSWQQASQWIMYNKERYKDDVGRVWTTDRGGYWES